MVKVSKKFFPILLIVIMCITMLFCGISVVKADDGETINIGHISDINYYPTYYSYKESNGDYNNSAFNKTQNTNATLLTESSENLRYTLEKFLLNPPDVLLVSGNLTLSGERQGLIDVANALRWLQNSIRANGKINFQVLVIPGTQDILNPKSRDLSSLNGDVAKNVTREDFVKIFAGLGYPNMSEEEAQFFYTDSEYNNTSNISYLPYNSDGKAYIHSENSNLYTFDYMINDFNQNIGVGELSYIANFDKYSFIAVDSVITSFSENQDKIIYSDNGKYLDNVNNFLIENVKNQRNIAFTNSSILNHFTFQENYMNSAIMKDYEDLLATFSKLKIYYNFSGKSLANDVANYVDYDGYTIYDIASPSINGVGAGYRISTIKYYPNGASDLVSTIYPLLDIGYNKLFESGYLLRENYADYGNILNGSIVSNVNDYANKKLMTNVINKLLEDYVNSTSFDMIKKFLESMLEDIFHRENVGDIPQIIAKCMDTLLDNFINEINTKVLDNYEYRGDIVSLQGEENKIYAFGYEMLYEIVNSEVSKVSGTSYTIQDLLIYGYTCYRQGISFDSIVNAPDWYSKGVDNLLNGSVMQDIFSIVLDDYYPYVEKFLNSTLDLSTNLEPGQIKDLNTLIKLITNSNMTISNIDVDVFINNVVSILDPSLGDNFVGNIGKYIKFYFSNSYARAYGEMLGELLVSFVTDGSPDGEYGKPNHVKYKDTDMFTLSGTFRTDVAPSIEDGREPSMLTMTFGNDPKTTKNFVWFTDKRIEGSDIQIVEGDINSFDPTKVKTISGHYEVYAYNYSLIDTPIYSSSLTKEIARHTVNLVGLKADTTYVYRVGDYSKGYFSPWYTFKTASKAEDKPFEVLLMTDAQGNTESQFNDTNKLLHGASEVFRNGYDFIINLGNLVDNAENMKQWGYALNMSRDIYGNKTQVMVNGVNDDIEFVAEKGYIPSDNVVVDYNTYDMHYLTSSVSGEKYYSFDYSGVHFTVLDTEDLVDNNLNPKQLEWLKADLEKTNLNNKVVLMHRGIYTAGPHANDVVTVNLRNTLTNIFNEGEVDLVLQGNEHVYSESKFIGNDGEVASGGYTPGSTIANNGNGVLYVCLGSAGDKFNEYETNDLPIYRGHAYQYPSLKNPTFGKLTFDGMTISYTSYIYDLDSGKITKIIDIIPWWGILLIALGIFVVITIIVAIVVVILIKNKKIKIKALEKYQQATHEKEVLEVGNNINIDVDNDENKK